MSSPLLPVGAALAVISLAGASRGSRAEVPTFKAGDVVRWKASFLRSTAWYTGVPKDGLVESVVDKGAFRGFPRVVWNTDPDNEPSPVNPANIEHVRRAGSRATDTWTTRRLLEELPMNEDVRTLMLSAVGRDGYLPNRPPQGRTEKFAAWLGIANNLNPALMRHMGRVMGTPHTKVFSDVDDVAAVFGPLIYAVEQHKSPYKWNIDAPRVGPDGVGVIVDRLVKLDAGRA